MRSQKYSSESGVRYCFSSVRKWGKSGSEARFPIERIVLNSELAGTEGHSVICVPLEVFALKGSLLGKEEENFQRGPKLAPLRPFGILIFL